jgi:hypothetical protein
MPKDMAGVMHEWKEGKLHSGSSTGPVVTSQKQAVAIGLSEQRQMQHPHRNLGSYLRPAGGKPWAAHQHARKSR